MRILRTGLLRAKGVLRRVESSRPETMDISDSEVIDNNTIEDDNLSLDNVIYGGSNQSLCIICRKERD